MKQGDKAWRDNVNNAANKAVRLGNEVAASIARTPACHRGGLSMVEQIAAEVVERAFALVHDLADGKIRTCDYGATRHRAQQIVAELPKTIDPDLIEARRIADEHSNRCGVKRNEPYAAGNCDDQVVAAILDGIKLGRTRSLARTDQETAHVR